jgi:hypothetical protein
LLSDGQDTFRCSEVSQHRKLVSFRRGKHADNHKRIECDIVILLGCANKDIYHFRRILQCNSVLPIQLRLVHRHHQHSLTSLMRTRPYKATIRGIRRMFPDKQLYIASTGSHHPSYISALKYDADLLVNISIKWIRLRCFPLNTAVFHIETSLPENPCNYNMKFITIRKYTIL